MVVCYKQSTIAFDMVRLRGIEPPHPAPEAGALSTELQAHNALLIIAELHSQVKGWPEQDSVKIPWV